MRCYRCCRPARGVLWIGWGYDYYGLLNDAFPAGLLGPATTAALLHLQPRTSLGPPGAMRASELSVARPYAKPSQADRQALSRIDYFSPVLEDEFRLVRRHQPGFSARYLCWNYATLEDDLAPPDSSGGTAQAGVGPNLLLGNSATPTNNHLEAFELIRKRIDLQGRKLVVPLSYGDPHYAELVIHVGRQQFGNAFVALRDFMARDDYIALLASCGVVVMNHRRQQALGNLLIAGQMGARCFLDPRNPLAQWLPAQGFAVEDIAQLHTQPLNAAQRATQRRAVADCAGRATRRRWTAALVDTLLQRQPAELSAA